MCDNLSPITFRQLEAFVAREREYGTECVAYGEMKTDCRAAVPCALCFYHYLTAPSNEEPKE